MYRKDRLRVADHRLGSGVFADRAANAGQTAAELRQIVALAAAFRQVAVHRLALGLCDKTTREIDPLRNPKVFHNRLPTSFPVTVRPARFRDLLDTRVHSRLIRYRVTHFFLE